MGGEVGGRADLKTEALQFHPDLLENLLVLSDHNNKTLNASIKKARMIIQVGYRG